MFRAVLERTPDGVRVEVTLERGPEPPDEERAAAVVLNRLLADRRLARWLDESR